MQAKILKPYAHSGVTPHAHWLIAAMPDADWHVGTDAQLLPLDGACALALTSALLAQMQALQPGQTLLAHEQDTVWRLRRVAAPDAQSLWVAQPLAVSRERCFQQLRSHLGERLAPQILHELRNPMNALSLHTDLLGRLIAMPEAAERAGASARVLRDRQRDLTARHDALVALWLAPVAHGDEQTMRTLVAGALRMVRNYGSLRDIRMQVDALDALDTVQRPRAAAHVELVLVAALLLVCDGLAGGESQELRIEWLADDSVPTLRIAAAPSAEADASGFAWNGRRVSNGEVLATLALLLDGEPMTLVQDGKTLMLGFSVAH